MRQTFYTLALFALCEGVLASSSASAQFVQLPMLLEITSSADMTVTRNGTTKNCSPANTRSQTSYLFLPPRLGSYDQGTRGFRCGDMIVQISQSVDVSSLSTGENFVIPDQVVVYSRIYVSYPDGHSVTVLEKTEGWLTNSEPTSWTWDIPYSPRSLQGIVFRNFTDHVVGSYGG